MSDAQTLLNLKEKIKKADREKTKMEGQRESSIKTLMKDFGVKSLKEAEKIFKKRSKVQGETKEILKKSVQKLEDDYDW